MLVEVFVNMGENYNNLVSCFAEIHFSLPHEMIMWSVDIEAVVHVEI